MGVDGDIPAVEVGGEEVVVEVTDFIALTQHDGDVVVRWVHQRGDTLAYRVHRPPCCITCS